MQPVNFNGVNMMLGAPDGWDAESHGECGALPVMANSGYLTSLWKPTFKERMQLLFNGCIQMSIISINGTQPPVSISVAPLTFKAGCFAIKKKFRIS